MVGEIRVVSVVSLDDMIFIQKIYGLPSNYPIIGEGKSDYGQTDTQTDTQTEFPLVDSTPSVEGVE